MVFLVVGIFYTLILVGSSVEHCVLLTEITVKKYESSREKTNSLGFQPGLIQTCLYSHRKKLESFDISSRGMVLSM